MMAVYDENKSVTPLVIRFGALGDMVLITALCRALAARYGHPCHVMGRGRWCADVFKELPFIQDVRTIVSRNAPYPVNPEQWRLVSWLREHRFDPLILIETDKKSYRFLRQAGHHPSACSCDVLIDVNEHVTHHHARLGGFVDPETNEVIKEYDFSPELRVSEEEIAGVRKWLKKLDCEDHPIILVQPGNRKTMGRFRKKINHKEWPIERWIKVMKEVLATIPDARILINGYRGDQPVASEMIRLAGDSRIIAVANQMYIRRLFALLKIAHSLISVDTGPAHAASALHVRSVVLFGKTDPRVNRPLNNRSRVIIVTGPAGAPEPDGKEAWGKCHSMADISWERVFEAWYLHAFKTDDPSAYTNQSLQPREVQN